MERLNAFHCDYCGRNVGYRSSFTTGYGMDESNNKACYQCCAESDRAHMLEHGKIALYLVMPTDRSYRGTSWVQGARVTNWPGSLVFDKSTNGHALWVKVGRHNIAGLRFDTWFVGSDGFVWHGVQYGENTPITHCKRTRQRAL